jgi:membrane-associated phospholipid phosphatase
VRTRLQALDRRYAWLSEGANRPRVFRLGCILLAHSGDSWFWLAGLGLLWWLGNAGWTQRALVMAVGILVTAVVVMAIKFTVRRSRPEGEWGRIYRSTDPHSFPSGHAARAAMLAVLGLGLGPAWLGIALLIWAPLVGLARVVLGVHYPSDVAAGMVLGAVMGGVVLLII